MTLEQLHATLRNRPQDLRFAAVMDLIQRLHTLVPVAFDNGELHNGAGENAGACALFAFGRRQGLDAEQVLACFGEHYRAVLADPQGQGHPNIRQFMIHGWAGVHHHGTALLARGESA